jgi:hypothetical protein
MWSDAVNCGTCIHMVKLIDTNFPTSMAVWRMIRIADDSYGGFAVAIHQQTEP